MECEVLDRCNLCDSLQIHSVDAENNICECLSCGYVFDSPRPTSNELDKFYSRATQYDPWLSEEAARDGLWERRLRKLRRTSREGTLLDVGAGIGQFLCHAKPFFTRVVGTEVSDSAIRIAKAKYGLELIKGDLANIEFADDVAFDNITAFHVLEHVPDPRKTVRACWRLLGSGGILLVAVPNDILSLNRRLKTGVKKVLRKMGVRKFRDPGKSGLRKITLDGSLDEIHLSHFTPSVLQRLLEGSGFRILEKSLDPYYVAHGIRLLCCHCCYAVSTCMEVVLRRNVYETIWMVGEKVIGHKHHGRLNGSAAMEPR